MIMNTIKGTAQEDEIVRLHSAGISSNKISKKLRVSLGGVTYTRYRLGLPANFPNFSGDITDPVLAYKNIIKNSKRYMESHKDKIHELGKRYRAVHKDEIRERMRTYEKEHRDMANKRGRRYYESHREKLNEKWRAYYYSNRDALNAKRMIYHEAHKDDPVYKAKIAARNKKRYQKTRAATEGS